MQQTSFPSLMGNEFLQQFAVCYVSVSVVHNLECPLIPCLTVLGLVVFQNPGCSGTSFFFVKSYLTLWATAYILSKYFCVSCMHRTCSLCVCFARLYGPWLVFDSFLSSFFPVISV